MSAVNLPGIRGFDGRDGAYLHSRDLWVFLDEASRQACAINAFSIEFTMQFLAVAFPEHFPKMDNAPDSLEAAS